MSTQFPNLFYYFCFYIGLGHPISTSLCDFACSRYQHLGRGDYVAFNFGFDRKNRIYSREICKALLLFIFASRVINYRNCIILFYYKWFVPGWFREEVFILFKLTHPHVQVDVGLTAGSDQE